MKKLIIIGASGHGKVVADIAQKTNKYSEICFIDDSPDVKECMGYKVIGTCQDIEKWIPEAEFFVAIGNSYIRENMITLLLEKKASIATLIHPQACVAEHVEIGLGTVVMAGVVINPDTKIGTGVIVNTSSSIDHDNIIEDYCHVSVGAHLAGTIHMQKHTWIGAGAIVSNNIIICKESTIGAGAVVVKDIDEKGTYVGVPARKMK